MKVGFFKDYIYTIETNPNGSITCKSGDIKQTYHVYSQYEASNLFDLYLDEENKSIFVNQEG